MQMRALPLFSKRDRGGTPYAEPKNDSDRTHISANNVSPTATTPSTRSSSLHGRHHLLNRMDSLQIQH
eukprot:scaffold5909_cov150-Skeletonema_menzelii.AAC.17